jgi:Protein of unknown function (DUF1207)
MSTVLLAIDMPAHGANEVAVPTPRDCRYPGSEQTTATPISGESKSLAFPQDDVFRPLLADPKQPQFLMSYQRMRFRGVGRSINAGFNGFGETFGLWGSRDSKCNGMQIGIQGAVFGQCNMDAPSYDLINSDYVMGIPFSMRRGPFSLRARLYHQSSHLGDEFLLSNPGIKRLNLSFEEAETIASYDISWVRVYGGGGYLIHRDPDLKRGKLQWGVEFRPPDRPSPILRDVIENLQLVPIVAVDFKNFEQQGWNLNANVVAGVELYRPGGTHRLRFLLSYYRGYNPYGQFFDQKIEMFGAGFYFNL